MDPIVISESDRPGPPLACCQLQEGAAVRVGSTPGDVGGIFHAKSWSNPSRGQTRSLAALKKSSSSSDSARATCRGRRRVGDRELLDDHGSPRTAAPPPAGGVTRRVQGSGRRISFNEKQRPRLHYRRISFNEKRLRKRPRLHYKRAAPSARGGDSCILGFVCESHEASADFLYPASARGGDSAA